MAGSCKTGTTTAAGDSTSVIDTTNFTDSFMNANFYDGWYLIMTSGDRSGEIRRVSSYSGSAGDFTLADALTGAPGSSKTFEVHSLDPADLKSAINRVLESRMYYWTYAYPTLVTDGDMETSGASNWTGSSASATKETSAVLYGTQSLKITNSGANGYARTASMSVSPGDSYYCEVACRPDTYTGTLIAYDVTNAANITTVAYASGREWKTLWINFSIPSGCYQLQIRLQGDDAAAVIYWDNLILQKLNATRLALPSWITEGGNVLEVQRRVRARAEASGVEYVNEELWDALPRFSVDQDRTAVNAFHLQLPYTISDRPLRLKCVRPYSTLSADSSTTTAPKDWVVAGAILELLRMNVLRAPGSEESEWKSQINAWKKDWMRLCRAYQPKAPERVRSPWDA